MIKHKIELLKYFPVPQINLCKRTQLKTVSDTPIFCSETTVVNDDDERRRQWMSKRESRRINGHNLHGNFYRDNGAISGRCVLRSRRIIASKTGTCRRCGLDIRYIFQRRYRSVMQGVGRSRSTLTMLTPRAPLR